MPGRAGDNSKLKTENSKLTGQSEFSRDLTDLGRFGSEDLAVGCGHRLEETMDAPTVILAKALTQFPARFVTASAISDLTECLAISTARMACEREREA